MEFSQWVLGVGDGRIGPEVEIPERCRVHGDLVEAVFGNALSLDDLETLRSRVILTPRNSDCKLPNANANALVQGEEKVYYSIDSMDLE